MTTSTTRSATTPTSRTSGDEAGAADDGQTTTATIPSVTTRTCRATARAASRRAPARKPMCEDGGRELGLVVAIERWHAQEEQLVERQQRQRQDDGEVVGPSRSPRPPSRRPSARAPAASAARATARGRRRSARRARAARPRAGAEPDVGDAQGRGGQARVRRQPVAGARRPGRRRRGGGGRGASRTSCCGARRPSWPGSWESRTPRTSSASRSAALVAALDDGKDQARKKPGLTGMRAVATGAVLYTAGKAAFSGRRFINERLGAGDDEPEDDEEDEEEEERRRRARGRGGRGLRGGRGARGGAGRRGGRGLRGAGGRGARGGARRRGGRGLRGGRGARGGGRGRGGRGSRRSRRGGRGLRGGRGRRGAQRRVRAAGPSRRGRGRRDRRRRSPGAPEPQADAGGAALSHGLRTHQRDGPLPARGGGRAAAARLVHRLPARAAQGRDLARARQEPLLHPRRSCSTEPEQPDPAQQTSET